MEAPTDRGATMAAGERAYAELAVALDAIDPANLVHGDNGAPWTVRDVYTHLYRWQRWATESLAASLATGSVVEAYADEAEMEALNTRWQAECSVLSVADAKRLCEESRREMVEAFIALTDEEWRRWGVKPYSAELDGSHYRGHLEYLKPAR